MKRCLLIALSCALCVCAAHGKESGWTVVPKRNATAAPRPKKYETLPAAWYCTRRRMHRVEWEPNPDNPGRHRIVACAVPALCAREGGCEYLQWAWKGEEFKRNQNPPWCYWIFDLEDQPIGWIDTNGNRHELEEHPNAAQRAWAAWILP